MLLLFPLAATFHICGADANLPAPSVVNTKEGVVACYWEPNLPNMPKFDSENIEAHLCNHILYGQAKLDKTTWELTHYNITRDVHLGGFRNISEMKKQNPSLKVEIEVNRNWPTPKEYQEMILDKRKRGIFVKSVVKFVTTNNFDGLHLHWGKPGAPIDQAKTKFTILLRELKTALHLVNLTLSIAIWTPLASNIDKNFEVANVYKEADLVFINAFHYFGNWFKKTGGFSPLYPDKDNEVPDEQYLNIDESWRHLLMRRAVPCKTILVVTAKGSAFRLKDPAEHGLGAESIEGVAPSIGGDPKFIEYCNLAQPTGEWTREWDEDGRVPYMYKDDQWLSYEDEVSVAEKLRYIEEQNMAGVALNNLAWDDFLGRCKSNNTFPLLRLMRKKLKNGGGECSGSARSAQTLHPLRFLLPLLALFTV